MVRRHSDRFPDVRVSFGGPVHQNIVVQIHHNV